MLIINSINNCGSDDGGDDGDGDDDDDGDDERIRANGQTLPQYLRVEDG